MRARSFVVGCLLGVSGVDTPLAHSDDRSGDWPAFRGPNGSGASAAVELPARFDVPTNVAWSAPVPPGHSSPIVKGRQLFLTALEGGKLLLLAFDVRTGTELWRYSLA